MWYKYDQQRQIHLTSDKRMTQLCEDYLVTLHMKKKNMCVSLYRNRNFQANA